jgi:hypothetical protein
MAVYCRLGRLPDSNPGQQIHSLVLLPMSHHYSSTLKITNIAIPKKKLTKKCPKECFKNVSKNKRLFGFVKFFYIPRLDGHIHLLFQLFSCTN